MCNIISIINNKGGVGKTTSTGFIAQLLAYLGKRVLVVDLDGQSNLSMMLNTYVEDTESIIHGITKASEENIFEIFLYRYKEKDDVLKTIRHTAIENLDIIPSSKRHKNTKTYIMSNQTGNNNTILKKALYAVRDFYDYILIDNAPADDILTLNSMFASDGIMIPVCAEDYSLKGLKETIDTIRYIKDEHDLDKPELYGVFITRAESNTVNYREHTSLYSELLGDKMCSTIRKCTQADQINSSFQPVLSACPNSNIVFDYAHLILDLNILDDVSADMLKQCIQLD